MRRNQYAGVCHSCGETVEAKTGRVLRVNGAWRTAHHNHAIYAATEIISANGEALPAGGLIRLTRKGQS